MMKRMLTWLAPGDLGVGGCSTLFAAPDTELVLSDGLGNKITVDVTGGVVTTSTTGAAAVGAAIYSTATGLVVLGTVGQFTVNTTGEGHANLMAPTLEDLNQIQASSTGAGTLTAQFTDTGYTGLASGFQLGVSGTNDSGIVASTADFLAF